MGNELVSDSLSFENRGVDEPSASLISYTEQFYSHLPFYLSIGMTFEQYWNEDCCLVKYYREAFNIKRERDNERMWLQGMYIYEALCDVSPVLRAFAKNGTKPVKYSSEPYAITKKEIERRRIEKEKAEYEQIKAKTNAFAVKFNALIAQRNGSEKDGGNSY